MFKPKLTAIAMAAFFAQSSVAWAQDDVREELELLKARIAELESKLEEQEQQQKQKQLQVQSEAQRETSKDKSKDTRRPEPRDSYNERLAKVEKQVEDNKPPAIEVGGAVRFQYVYEDYNDGNEDRLGDFEFDLARINFRGTMGDVILSAEYRWFQYMDVVKHAWFGYDFTDEWQGQVGIVAVPFGVRPYNSHSYFFNAPFYAGYEDEHDAGVRFQYRSDSWDWDLAFYKSDEQGGVDTSASNRFDKYSYDPVGIRVPGEGIFDDPTLEVGENNSWLVRGARKFELGDEQSAEIGGSYLFGDLHDGTEVVGEHKAWAAHGIYRIQRWEFMAQITDYEYETDVQNSGIVTGAYAYYDTIPSAATFYTANVAYTKPVSNFGPVDSLTFYNNYSLMTDKQGFQDDTFMNVLGMGLAAGGVYTYFDFVIAENQPFVGGSLAEDGGDTNTRFNINFGYYF